MDDIKVERLLINYKTLEEFKRFKEYGHQELSMLEDLQNNIVENDSESPFYGIYYGKNLVARMSLYKIKKKYDEYFDPPHDYLELWKLEVLPDYRNRNYGTALVDYAKSFNLPIKTNPRVNSHGFWEKMGFVKADYKVSRDLGENPLIWMPEGIKEKKT
ncbi:MAG TPA: N-acetyltransferase [Bacillota bacterium]|nr:N-acetyltransferase [Bacillota bacterium]